MQASASISTTATKSCKPKSATRSSQKIPYMLVIGGKEAEAGTVSVRHRTKGDLGPRPLEQFLADLRQEIDSTQSLIS